MPSAIAGLVVSCGLLDFSDPQLADHGSDASNPGGSSSTGGTNAAGTANSPSASGASGASGTTGGAGTTGGTGGTSGTGAAGTTGTTGGTGGTSGTGAAGTTGGTTGPAGAGGTSGGSGGSPPTCDANQTLCGDTCVDVVTDAANCGSCGTKCCPNAGCIGGSCVSACPQLYGAPLLLCGGAYQPSCGSCQDGTVACNAIATTNACAWPLVWDFELGRLDGWYLDSITNNANDGEPTVTTQAPDGATQALTQRISTNDTKTSIALDVFLCGQSPYTAFTADLTGKTLVLEYYIDGPDTGGGGITFGVLLHNRPAAIHYINLEPVYGAWTELNLPLDTVDDAYIDGIEFFFSPSAVPWTGTLYIDNVVVL